MLAARRRLRMTGAAVACALTLATGCSGGGSTPLSEPGDRPPKLVGSPAPVDVCALVTPEQAGALLDRDLGVVGVEYGAPRVTTYRCMFGSEFGVPEVTVELAAGPIARNVFIDAYGPAAGGDPQPVRHLGRGAFYRAEKDVRSMHAIVNGSVLSLDVVNDPAKPVSRADVLALGRLTADAVPSNPQIVNEYHDHSCAKVKDGEVAAATGAEPTLASGISGPDQSLMCSWTSRPGAATVTVFRSPEQVKGYEQTLDRSLYTKVALTGVPASVTALSRTDRSGDLLLLDGTSAVAEIEVVPAAGFSGAGIPTTPGEITLATAVARELL